MLMQNTLGDPWRWHRPCYPYTDNIIIGGLVVQLLWHRHHGNSAWLLSIRTLIVHGRNSYWHASTKPTMMKRLNCDQKLIDALFITFNYIIESLPCAGKDYTCICWCTFIFDHQHWNNKLQACWFCSEYNKMSLEAAQHVSHGRAVCHLNGACRSVPSHFCSALLTAAKPIM